VVVEKRDCLNEQNVTPPSIPYVGSSKTPEAGVGAIVLFANSQ